MNKINHNPDEKLIDLLNYKYHHVGLIVNTPQPNEEYNEEMKYYASGYFQSQYGIELLRFEDDSLLHPLIKIIPHIAFEVDNIEEAIGDYPIIEKLSSPADGVSVCFVEVNGAPVEFIQFDKPEQKIWPHPNKLELKYHHFGISTKSIKENMIHLPHLKIHCTDHEDNPFGLQWMNYDVDASYPKSVKEISHVAFRVDDLLDAIKDKKVIIQPNSPSKGVLVAFIEENGIPIEFLQID